MIIIKEFIFILRLFFKLMYTWTVKHYVHMNMCIQKLQIFTPLTMKTGVVVQFNHNRFVEILIRRQELIRFQFNHNRFIEIIRKQPYAQTEFIEVIYPSLERLLNPRWKMSRGFQTLMLMIPYKLIISESYLTFTFVILVVAVAVFVLTVVAVFIINSVILYFLILFFYWFYMRPTKGCKIELHRHVFFIFIIIFIFFST